MLRLVSWPCHTIGRNTDSPSCLNTRRYISPYFPDMSGRKSVYHGRPDVYICTSKGVRNGPSELPTVDSTTVSASFPRPNLVIITPDETAVGTQPVKTNPTKSPASMNVLFVAHALTTPNTTAEVTRKHCTCTKRWIRQRV